MADATTSVAYRIEPVAEAHGIEGIGISANELFATDFRPNIGVALISMECCVLTCRSCRRSRCSWSCLTALLLECKAHHDARTTRRLSTVAAAGSQEPVAASVRDAHLDAIA